MTNKETFEELEQLKAQMSTLKKHLSDQEIVNEGQVANITKEYHRGNLGLAIFWGIITGVCICLGPTYNFIASANGNGFGWGTVIIFIAVTLALLFRVYLSIDMSIAHYAIVGEDFITYNFWHKEVLRIPVSSIRYIELLNVPKHNKRNVRIVYNKFDDHYLMSNNNKDIVADILRVNPDIEIRKEME